LSGPPKREAIVAPFPRDGVASKRRTIGITFSLPQRCRQFSFGRTFFFFTTTTKLGGKQSDEKSMNGYAPSTKVWNGRWRAACH
jgi:hypothetical protein